MRYGKNLASLAIQAKCMDAKQGIELNDIPEPLWNTRNAPANVIRQVEEARLILFGLDTAYQLPKLERAFSFSREEVAWRSEKLLFECRVIVSTMPAMSRRDCRV